jgi:hypothetical protein
VPAFWPWPEINSLELLADSPLNCLLRESYNREFVAAAAQDADDVLEMPPTEQCWPFSGHAIPCQIAAIRVYNTTFDLQFSF